MISRHPGISTIPVSKHFPLLVDVEERRGVIETILIVSCECVIKTGAASDDTPPRGGTDGNRLYGQSVWTICCLATLWIDSRVEGLHVEEELTPLIPRKAKSLMNTQSD